MRLDYAQAFGLDPDKVNPTLRSWHRWQVWRAAQASARVWAWTRENENWSEHITAEQQATFDWALEGLVDE